MDTIKAILDLQCGPHVIVAQQHRQLAVRSPHLKKKVSGSTHPFGDPHLQSHRHLALDQPRHHCSQLPHRSTPAPVHVFFIYKKWEHALIWWGVAHWSSWRVCSSRISCSWSISPATAGFFWWERSVLI